MRHDRSSREDAREGLVSLLRAKWTMMASERVSSVAQSLCLRFHLSPRTYSCPSPSESTTPPPRMCSDPGLINTFSDLTFLRGISPDGKE